MSNRLHESRQQYANDILSETTTGTKERKKLRLFPESEEKEKTWNTMAHELHGVLLSRRILFFVVGPTGNSGDEFDEVITNLFHDRWLAC